MYRICIRFTEVLGMKRLWTAAGGSPRRRGIAENDLRLALSMEYRMYTICIRFTEVLGMRRRRTAAHGGGESQKMTLG